MATRNYMSAVNRRIGFAAQHGRSESWVKPTGRIDSKRTAEILGFQEHDIPVLVSEGFLKPLGKPVQNATKYFAAVCVLELAQDAVWLSKATQTIYDHWKVRNANREKPEQEQQQT
jgi:hypothetical protein